MTYKQNLTRDIEQQGRHYLPHVEHLLFAAIFSPQAFVRTAGVVRFVCNSLVLHGAAVALSERVGFAGLGRELTAARDTVNKVNLDHGWHELWHQLEYKHPVRRCLGHQPQHRGALHQGSQPGAATVSSAILAY